MYHPNDRNDIATGSVMARLNKMRFVVLAAIIGVSVIFAGSAAENGHPEKKWAIGIAFRSATIPYGTEVERNIYSVIPLIFYEGNYLFFHGISGGAHLLKREKFELNFVGRIHFVDLPDEYQNEVQPTNLDWGVQFRHYFKARFFWEGEALSDMDAAFSANVRAGYDFKAPHCRVTPYLELRYKSRDYNSRYFGLTLEDIDPGLDLSLGVVGYYHLWSNLLIFGSARITWLDPNAREARYVNDDYTGAVVFGFGFSNDPSKPEIKKPRNRPYIRFAHGRATYSDFWSTNFFLIDPEPYRNQLTSVFYGHPLTDNIFGIPLDVYLTGGLVYHWPSEVQSQALELDLGIKAYININWPFRWRIGGAEGMSYITSVTYIERHNMETGGGYEPSKFLNYLDWSYDINLGLFSKDLDRLWLGYSTHHRSGIWEAAQQYGRISGGSNYYTFYLQWEFR